MRYANVKYYKKNGIFAAVKNQMINLCIELFSCWFEMKNNSSHIGIYNLLICKR